MEENEKENIEEEISQAEENPDFIQEFIERKKLQNRVLQELIDKITHSEHTDKTQPTNKKQKP